MENRETIVEFLSELWEGEKIPESEKEREELKKKIREKLQKEFIDILKGPLSPDMIKTILQRVEIRLSNLDVLANVARLTILKSSLSDKNFVCNDRPWIIYLDPY